MSHFDRALAVATAREMLTQAAQASTGPWVKGKYATVHDRRDWVAAVFRRPEDAAFVAQARDALPLLAAAVLEMAGEDSNNSEAQQRREERPNPNDT